MEECTCCLFLMEPFPSTAILVIVSSCNLFIELPFGPSNFPTKLNFGCSLTGTTTRTLRRIGFSWYMSTILVSLPGGFPPRWILAISKMRKNENQYQTYAVCRKFIWHYNVDIAIPELISYFYRLYSKPKVLLDSVKNEAVQALTNTIWRFILCYI